jgi:hypothetical protein
MSRCCAPLLMPRCNETTNYHVIRGPAGMASGARELSLAWKPAGSST